MGRRGIHIPPPMRAAEMLERRFGVLIGRARDLALEILVPAIASGDQSRIADALTRIDNELAELSHIAELERMARDTADRASKRHGKLFMAGLAAAVGMAIKGSDDGSVAAPQIAGPLGGFGAPPPLPPGPGLASGGPKRIKGILVAKLSAEPSLLAHQFATENARRIKSLSDEVVPALRDEVVRAVTFGYDHEEAAARLQAKWARSGVPVAKGNLKPRVGLIVRDQVAKLNSKLTSARSRAAEIGRAHV